MKKALNVLWDFDGTIFDTYPLIVSNFYKVSGKKENEDRDEVLKWFKKSSIEVFDFYGVEYSEENLKKMRFLEREASPEQTPPFSGVKDALALTTKNVIVTNKDRKAVEKILNHYNMAYFFDDMICADEGFERKPHPRSYKYMHEKHHIDLVVGDRKLDFTPARKLGIRTCSYQNRDIESDYYIDDYEEFSKIILAVKNGSASFN